ncbi:MAG: hypothetical protein PHC28_13340 [Flavobacterium sp.]|uniref:hypothetical protein n=1 Tax=Flavobacterium sp. TaxID=239 RepID=UPI00263200AF|nr:hypothetical protein [Flavobacterium sp.]MDD5151436.1 hypothetical protein [Flavobacterium sp.]
MATLNDLVVERNYKKLSLGYLKFDIEEFIKCPIETVSIENLKSQYDFLLREINNIDLKIKIILISESQSYKEDLKKFVDKLSKIPSPFDVSELPSYSEIFK